MRLTIVAAAIALCASSAALAQRNGRNVPGSGVIDSPGAYTLNQDLTSGPNRAAIVIAANDVSLDLNGMVVTGPGGKQGTGIEIRNASGVRVFNGIIANQAFGVTVLNSNSVVLKDLQIRGQGLPIVSLPPETGIMIMQSKNVVVENNSIYNTGLGIFVRGGMSGGNRIAHNTVTAGTNGALAICYNPGATGTEGPAGDLIYGNILHGFGTGLAASAGSRYNVFQGNTIFFRETAANFENQTNQDVDNRKVQLQ